MIVDIIDKYGELWQRDTVTDPLVVRDDHPKLVSYGEIYDWLTLTIDGKLYDLRSKIVVETKFKNNKQLRAGYTSAPLYKSCLLTDDGILYIHLGVIDRVVSENIKYLVSFQHESYSKEFSILAINNEGQWVSYYMVEIVV